MAKLTAPLLSLGASGQIGKAIVYTSWKGIDVGKQYVIPANPNSDPQKTQRGYLTSAMNLWKSIAFPMNALDRANFDRKAGIQSSPLSGFNQYIKQYINTKILSVTPLNIFNTVEVSKAAGAVQITCSSQSSTINVQLNMGSQITNLATAIGRTEAATPGQTHTFDITDTIEGQVFFYEIVDLTTDSLITLGIGRVVTAAA
jgi:hypothetical protein